MRSANLWLSLISFCLLALEPGTATTTSRDNDSAPSVALTRQAIALGMEPAALGELWRTKQPVIVSKTDELGQLYTTTYELSPDGQHISNKVIKEEPSTTTSTTTTTSPSPPAAPQPTNPQTDWEYVPSSLGNRRTYTLGSNWPNFGARLPEWPSFNFPAGVTPQTTTKTSQDDQGRTVTTTTKTYKGPTIGNSWSTGTELGANWPNFEFPTGGTPQTTTKTEQDDQGRTVTTQTKTYKSPVFTTWTSGGDLLPSVSNTFPQGLPPWFNNIPHFADETPSLTPPSAQPVPVPAPLPFPTQPTVESMQPPLPTPPSHTTTPKTIATFNLDELPGNTRTRITSYSSNFNGAAPPKTADLAPPVRDLLDRGGITDEDIQNAQALGRDIVRTHVLPDGRVIKTRLRVSNSAGPAPAAAVPLPAAPPSQAQPEFMPFPAAAVPLPTAPPSQAQPEFMPFPNEPTYQRQPVAQSHQRDNSIENFLSQVHLTPVDIQAQNGELVKTIVDQNGRVLSVKFVLSTVKGDEQGQGQQEQPTK